MEYLQFMAFFTTIAQLFQAMETNFHLFIVVTCEQIEILLIVSAVACRT